MKEAQTSKKEREEESYWTRFQSEKYKSTGTRKHIKTYKKSLGPNGVTNEIPK